MLITMPNNYINEREYIIKVLLEEHLGLTFTYEFRPQSDYIINFNNKEIVIKDSFFNNFNSENFLFESNIPKKVEFTSNPFIVEEDIPVIYGDNTFYQSEERIFCGIDIFASAFFMLTRWEEYVVKTRDYHGRFNAKMSLAFKNDFLHRPVVNEYVEMLWNMFKFFNLDQERKKREFAIIPTHDVDHINYWTSISKNIKKLGIALVKDKSVKKFLTEVFDLIKVKLLSQRDRYDTFDFLMNQSDAIASKSRFYFMSGGKTKYDNNYSLEAKKTSKLINHILKRNHLIGFHPSYDTALNELEWQNEKNKLEQRVVGNVIKEGRQHYLRFEVPFTWRNWEKNGMSLDSTMGYADQPGFRCGTCYPFSVYDVKDRKHLSLKESPLILMEATFNKYETSKEEKITKDFLYFYKKTKKYNGDFVFLWHNSSFNTFGWENAEKLYAKLLKYHIKG